MALTTIGLKPLLLVTCFCLTLIPGNNAPGAELNSGNGKVPNSATLQNLLTAYKGEMEAIAKYEAFAKKAHQEGQDQIALLFTAISKSEVVHALNHKRVLTGMGIGIPVFKPEFKVKSTKENLQDAIAGESYEAYSMYPGFIMTADKEASKDALVSFNFACKTEIKHKLLYEQALAAIILHEEKDLPSVYYICQVCGMIFPRIAPSRCSLCLTENGKFLTVDKF